ncbi:MAG: aspartyl protease family protein, partial [Rubrivivax sp.]
RLDAQRRRLLLSALAAAGAAGCGVAPAPPRSASSAGEMPLQLLRTGDIGGLPWVELELAGMPTRWLIDSGATTALISPALAAQLGLPKLSSVRVAMAGGAQTVERFTLPPLPHFGAAGPAEASAVALDPGVLLGLGDSPLHGVLGAAWLRHGATTFDFARARLSWGPAPSPASASAALGLPLRWDAGLPTVSLAIGARAADSFLLDTGNAGALVVFAQRAQALLAEASGLPATTVHEPGGNVEARFARIDRLSAPGVAWRQVPAALESGAAARRGGHFDRLAGSLGVALFEAGSLTIDGPGERLWIDLAGLPEPSPLPGGFGLRLAQQAGGGLRIGALIDGGPAAAAGVEVGDSVVGIDAADVERWPVAQAWQAMAHRPQVTLVLRRAGGARRQLVLRRAPFFPLLR